MCGGISSQQAGDGIPFLPLYGKENYGSHAIKNAIKTAADEGVDWVAIAPVEQLHHAKRTKYLGDIEFYGNRFGKAGFKTSCPASFKAIDLVPPGLDSRP